VIDIITKEIFKNKSSLSNKQSLIEVKRRRIDTILYLKETKARVQWKLANSRE
jgi:hypothetical protein